MTAALTPSRPFTAAERQLLENALQLHRSELLAAVRGLSDARPRSTPGAFADNTDLLGEAFALQQSGFGFDAYWAAEPLGFFDTATAIGPTTDRWSVTSLLNSARRNSTHLDIADIQRAFICSRLRCAPT